MKFLVLSDIHGNLENLEKLNPMAKEADGIIFAGDFTEFENEKTGLPVLKALCKMNENIFALIYYLHTSDTHFLNVQSFFFEHYFHCRKYLSESRHRTSRGTKKILNLH